MRKMIKMLGNAAAISGLAALCSGCAEIGAALIIGDSIDHAAGNVQTTSSSSARPKNTIIRAQPAQVNVSIGKTPYSFAYTGVEDRDGNGRNEPNEFTGVSDSYSLRGNSTIFLQSRTGGNFKDLYPVVEIKNSGGDTVYSQRGNPIWDEFLTVPLRKNDLRKAKLIGKYKIEFHIEDLNNKISKNRNERIKKIIVDEYYLSFY